VQKSAPAPSPGAYIASLSGWQRRYAEALRSAVSSAASLRRSVSSLAFGGASACGESSLVSSLVASSNWQHSNWSREPLWIAQQWSVW
jgi:hypothetical protein